MVKGIVIQTPFPLAFCWSLIALMIQMISSNYSPRNQKCIVSLQSEPGLRVEVEEWRGSCEVVKQQLDQAVQQKTLLADTLQQRGTKMDSEVDRLKHSISGTPIWVKTGNLL